MLRGKSVYLRVSDNVLYVNLYLEIEFAASKLACLFREKQDLIGIYLFDKNRAFNKCMVEREKR